MTQDEAIKVLREAIDSASDLAGAEAYRVHETYAGYKPDKHQAVDADVDLMNQASAALEVLRAQLARIEPAEPVDLDMAARIDAAMLAEPSEEMLVLARKAIEYQAKFKLLSEGEQRAIISRAVAQCFPGTTDQQEGLIDRVEPVSAIDSDCHVCGGSYSHKPDCAYINATPQPIAQPAPSIPDFDLAVSDYRAMLAAAPKQNDGGE